MKKKINISTYTFYNEEKSIKDTFQVKKDLRAN